MNKQDAARLAFRIGLRLGKLFLAATASGAIIWRLVLGIVLVIAWDVLAFSLYMALRMPVIRVYKPSMSSAKYFAVVWVWALT